MLLRLRVYLARRSIRRWDEHVAALKRAEIDILMTRVVIAGEQAKRRAALAALVGKGGVL